MEVYKYQLTTDRTTCPYCHKSGQFKRYINTITGELLPEKYGRCNRENNCGEWVKPENNTMLPDGTETKYKQTLHDLFESDTIEGYNYFHLNKKHGPNVFIWCLINYFGIDKALTAYQLYKLGTFYDGAVIYPYIFNGNVHSGKIMWYNDDMHRDKENHKYINWLHSYKYTDSKGQQYINNADEDFQLCTPLFGWDLIKEDSEKKICIVESEKTAVIMSIVLPEFIWIATGGKHNLQPYKFPYNNNRNWVVFPDLSDNKDTEGKAIETTKEHWVNQMNKISQKLLMIIDFPQFTPNSIPENILNEYSVKGYDVADFVIDEIKGKLPQQWLNGYDNYIDYLRSIINNNN